jgi:hypothetical protein
MADGLTLALADLEQLVAGVKYRGRERVLDLE